MTIDTRAGNLEGELQQQVKEAISAKAGLSILGSGTKSFYGGAASGRALPVSAHRGILQYEPSELMVTTRAGTTLEELESALAAEGQMLGFEPPRYGAGATLGGTIACGFSGPRRPFAGSARDFVLGCKLINGRGDIVSFGGPVMKNVAGFDASRLMVGALGTLGVLLELTLKVLPKPRQERTSVFDCTADQARVWMLDWASHGLPISAMAYDGQLRVRLSGAKEAVRAALNSLGGDSEECSGEFWSDLKEHRLPFFEAGQDLWRVSVPPAAPPAGIEGAWLIDWGGAQRWLQTAVEPSVVFGTVEKLGGHATLFRSARTGVRFQPMPGNLVALHRRMKEAFDPDRIFNSGRMYPEW